MQNVSKPTTTITNQARQSSSLGNASRPSFTPLWSVTVYPWQLAFPWQTFGEIINETKVT